MFRVIEDTYADGILTISKLELFKEDCSHKRETLLDARYDNDILEMKYICRDCGDIHNEYEPF